MKALSFVLSFGKKFTVIALPIKIKGVSGGPLRIVAILLERK